MATQDYRCASNPARFFSQTPFTALTLYLHSRVGFSLVPTLFQSPDRTPPDVSYYQTPAHIPMKTLHLWILGVTFRMPSCPPCVLLGNALPDTTRLTFPIVPHFITIVMQPLTPTPTINRKRSSCLRPDMNLGFIAHPLHGHHNAPHHPPMIPRHRIRSLQRTRCSLSHVPISDIKLYTPWTALIRSTMPSRLLLPVYKASP